MKLWKIKITDTKSAFLQGQNIERDLFLVLPKDSDDENKLRKLNKAVYGLNDLARQWYVSAKEVIENLGCIQSNLILRYFSITQIIS